jgi:hypothetical protein
VVEQTFEGVLISDGECREVEQTCHKHDSIFYMWNKPRLERLLSRRGVLSKYDLNGLNVLFFQLGELESVLGEKLSEDGYYLVKL